VAGLDEPESGSKTVLCYVGLAFVAADTSRGR